MSSRQKRKASSGNRIGMIFIGTVVGLLIVVMFIQRGRLKKKIAQYQAANTVLTEQIQEEKPQQKTQPSLKMTFENFVIGDSNKLAYSMAVAVAENPGKMKGLNPLFIYGKPGQGTYIGLSAG